MVLEEFIQSFPKISIIIISFIVTLLITIVRYYTTDRERMKEIRDRQKALRLEMKQYKDHPEKMMEINKKMLEDMPEQMKHSLKPMMITLIPTLIVFAWLRSTYALTSISGSWLWWYIGASICFGILFGG